MAIVTHTTTQTFEPPASTSDARGNTLIVDANGGSLAVEVLHAEDPDVWIATPDSPYSADTVVKIHTGGATVRITPSGGATYNWLG